MPQNNKNPNKRRTFFKTFLAAIAGALALKASKVLAQNEPSSQTEQSSMAFSNGTLGQITMFAGNFAPAKWLFCHGQLLNISDYSALFYVLGNMYGGDGISTFALPDLRGRVPVGTGMGPGLTNRYLGQRAGTENSRLSLNQVPYHTHNVTTQVTTKCSSNAGTSSDPAGGYLARNAADIPHYATSADNTMASDAVSVTSSVEPAGSSVSDQSINNMQPFCTINFIICVDGEFPQRP